MTKMCEACGKAPAVRKYCAPCGQEIRVQKKRDWVHAHKKEAHSALPCKGILEIVQDALPVEEGGFRPGTRFDAITSAAMIRLRALAEGTIVKAGGLLYKITYKEGAYQ